MCEVNIKSIPRLEQCKLIKEAVHASHMSSVPHEVTLDVTTE
jgi:hypothetical protein